MLLVGPRDRVIETLALLGVGHIRMEIGRGGTPLHLPTHNALRGLVLHDVDFLPRDGQRALMMWLDERKSVQLICTSRQPLFPLIAAGAFLEDLYYRLNTIYLLLSDADVS